MIILDFIARVLLYGGGLVALAFLVLSAYNFHIKGLARVKAYNAQIAQESEKNRSR